MTATEDAPAIRRRDRLGGEHKHLLAGSAALVVGAAVQAVTGALFWLAAARIDSTDDVGRATALFTSVLFIAYLAGLGQQVALARFSPGTDRDSHIFFTWGAVGTGLAAAVIAPAYLVLNDTEAIDALVDWHPIFGPLAFAVCCAGAALSLVVDVRWMTVRRWVLVLVRITLTGLGRFPLLLVPDGGNETLHLFFVAAIPLAISGFAAMALMPRVTGERHRLRPRPLATRSFLRYSGVNYLSTLAYQAPQFVLPVIVLREVEPDVNAAFYVAWGIVAVGLYVPMAIGQSLLAEGGKDGAHLRSQVRVVLLLAVGMMTVATAATAVGRDLVTAVYGDDYSDAARILPMLVAGSIPWAITSVYLTEARVLHRHLDTVAITTVLTISILVPAQLLVPENGLDGAARSFIVGNTIAAAVAFGFHRLGVHRTPKVVPEPEPADAIAEVLHP